MPIVEGQAVGRPVVTSILSPMKEVASDAAVLVNPSCIEELRSAYIRIIRDAQLRAELIKKGVDNCKRYNVEAITKKYHEFYCSMCQ